MSPDLAGPANQPVIICFFAPIIHNDMHSHNVGIIKLDVGPMHAKVGGGTYTMGAARHRKTLLNGAASRQFGGIS